MARLKEEVTMQIFSYPDQLVEFLKFEKLLNCIELAHIFSTIFICSVSTEKSVTCNGGKNNKFFIQISSLQYKIYLE